MAYAALCSLTQTVDKIMGGNFPISDKQKQQIRSVYEPFIFLQEFLKQEFLKDFPEKAKNLDGRVRDAANEANNIIESFMVKEVTSDDEWKYFAAKSKLDYQMTKIREQTDLISRGVMILKNNSQKPTRIGGAIKKDAASSSSCAAVSPSRLTPIGKVDYMIGLDKDLVAIKSRLCGEPSSRQVIPIVGMGGIGKTTLAKYAYDDPLTMEHFDIRAWVTVTQDYSADVILSCLLASVEMFYKDGSKRSSDEALLVGEKVFRILKQRRYLIVLDDIWCTEAWDDIMRILPDDDNGSRIMLTTRITDVAAYPDPDSPLHEMRLMDESQSWNLLQKKAFLDHQDCPPQLEDIGKEIVRSCKGLPCSRGSWRAPLRGQPNSRFMEENCKKCAFSCCGRKLRKDIAAELHPLARSSLRPCFLYLGMFPEDCEVRVSQLIRLWAAEGFLTSADFEQEAEECLKNLVSRSLVLVSKRKSDGRIKSCSLHDLMRDLCIKIAHQERFLANFSSRYVIQKGTKYHRRVSVTPSISLPYLSKANGATLSSIFCSGDVYVEDLLKKFRLLRVLDAGEACLTSLPDQLFALVYLEYLAIYYLGRIPAAISKLQKLQTLILHSRNEWRLFRVHAICLPEEIWRMPQLRHLVFYGRLPNPNPNPEGLQPSVLGNLQALSIVSQDVCTERILRMIPNLKKLEIHCSGGPQSQNFMKHLVHLHQLETLKVRSYFSNEIWHKDDFTFPGTLTKLTLSRLPLPWEEMTVVGSLPNLRVLKLTHQTGKGDIWETCEEEFPKLEILLIEKSDLQLWITESRHFPLLKRLVLDDCWQLMEIPEGIGEVSTLELIEVKGRARKSLVESANRILEEQREWGDEDLQVRCMTRR